jgi:hypothetical protein
MTSRAQVRVKVPGPRGPEGTVTPELLELKGEVEANAETASQKAGVATGAATAAGQSAAATQQDRDAVASDRTTVSQDREAVTAARETTLTKAGEVVQDRLAVAADRTATASDRAASAAAKAASELARDQSQAASTGTPQFNSLAAFAAGTSLTGDVVQGPLGEIGFYGRTIPSDATSAPVRLSPYTRASLGLTLDADIDARRALAGRTAGYEVSPIGKRDEFVVKDLNGGGFVVGAEDTRGRKVTGLAPARTFEVSPIGPRYDPMTYVELDGATRVVGSIDRLGRTVKAGAVREFAVSPIARYIAADVDAAGRLVNGTKADASGTTIPVGAVEERIVYGTVTGRSTRQIGVRRTPGIYVFPSGGPNDVSLISTGNGSAKIKRNGQIHDLRWRPVAIDGSPYFDFQLFVGQSNQQGNADTGVAERAVYWRDPVHERGTMFDSSWIDGLDRGPRPFQLAPMAGNKGVSIDPLQLMRVIPLRGASHAGDEQYFHTAAEGCVHALLGQHLSERARVHAAVIGTGSTAIASFLPGTAHMTSIQRAINRAGELAVGMGRILRVTLHWNQGEEDNEIGTTASVYQAALLTIRDFIRDLVVSLGGVFVGLFVAQCMQSIATSMAGLAQAALALAGEIVLVPTHAILPGWSGSTHYLPLMHLPLGQSIAYAVAETIATGTLYKAPRVEAGNAKLVNSQTIECAPSGGNGAYQVDTTTIPDAQDAKKGVTVHRAGSPVTIASVLIPSPGKITIATNDAFQVGDVIGFGVYGAAGAALMPAAAAPRIPMRDTSNWPCGLSGQPISGWFMAHRVTVTAPTP